MNSASFNGSFAIHTVAPSVSQQVRHTGGSLRLIAKGRRADSGPCSDLDKLVIAPPPRKVPMPHPPAITPRPFHEADTAFFTGKASDERVTRFIGDGQPWDEQTIQERIRAALQEDPLDSIGASRWFLAVEANEPVGIVVSSRKDAGVEVGYWVSPDHWGRGISGAMPDAALASIPDIYLTRELFARVDPANAVSTKLLTRRGFQLDTHHEGLDHYILV
ncbi:hypothetical protein CVS28_19095 [Arthrobacter glacialis]|nr:hypothetical protein CVS28_19095 [Arthrobacter glacialis]